MTRRTLLAALAFAAVLGCSQGAGSADRKSLSDAQPVGASAECPNGGQKILTGVDANGDGVLQPEEVTQVTYVCNGAPPPTCSTFEGGLSVNVQTWADLVAQGCTRLTGALEMYQFDGVSLGLVPSPLVRVGAIWMSYGNQLEFFELPNLETVDGDVYLYVNPALRVVSLPKLRHVGGSITIQGSGVVDLALPLLESVGGEVVFETNAALAHVEMPSVLSVGGRVAFLEDPALDAVNLASLRSVGGSVTFNDSAANGTVNLGALQTVGGEVSVFMSALSRLDLGSLARADFVHLYRADGLTDLSLPALEHVNGFDVSFSGSLVTLEADAVTSLAHLCVTEVPSLTRLSMRSLTALEASELAQRGTIDYAPALASVELPALASVATLILDAPFLTTLDLHGLAEVTENLYLRAGSVTRLDLSRLATVGTAGLPSSLGITGGSLASIDLSALVHVEGSLAFGVAGLDVLELPELTSVEGSLGIGSSARRDDPQTPANEAGTPSVLTRVSLPKLERVNLDFAVGTHPALSALEVPVLASAGSVTLTGLGLGQVSLPALTQARRGSLVTEIGYNWYSSGSTGELRLEGNPGLTSFDAPLLTTVDGPLWVKTEDSLPAFSLPALRRIGGIVQFLNDPALASVSLPALEKAGSDVYLWTLPSLTTVDLPVLATVGSRLWIVDDASLASVSFPALTRLADLKLSSPALVSASFPALAEVTAYVNIIENPVLANLELPALSKVVWTLNIYNNPALRQCQAQGIQDQLHPPFPPSVSIANNGGAGTCP